jgi:hypothetical protein
MKLCHVLGLLFAALSCARPPAPPPPLSSRTVAVLPPNNQTGDTLLVAGASILEKYALNTDRITVPDVLASEARLQLLRYGFDVLAPDAVDAATSGRIPTDAREAAAIAAGANLEGSVLYIDLRRWEVDVPFHPSSVIASLQLTLLDPASGRILWTADHPSRPVPTVGVVNLGDAYAIAARKVMEELLAPLGAEPHQE